MEQAPKTFFGNPCKYGHGGLRYKSGACVVCSKEHSRRQREAPGYRARKQQYFQNYFRKPGNREADRARHARWRKTPNGKRSVTDNHFRRQYGITIEQFEAMVERQQNKCAICERLGSAERHRRLSVDHDHKTQSVRDLLCDDCNVGIGTFGEDAARLERAAVYLRRHRED